MCEVHTLSRRLFCDVLSLIGPDVHLLLTDLRVIDKAVP
jgi:hypothetical protein